MQIDVNGLVPAKTISPRDNAAHPVDATQHTVNHTKSTLQRRFDVVVARPNIKYRISTINMYVLLLYLQVYCNMG